MPIFLWFKLLWIGGLKDNVAISVQFSNQVVVWGGMKYDEKYSTSYEREMKRACNQKTFDKKVLPTQLQINRG